MIVTLSIPNTVLFKAEVTKIHAEGEHGCFCILPRHQDFLASLVPGILVISSGKSKTEHYFANDVGLLVKQENEVHIAVRRAVQSSDLGELQQTVREHYEKLSENDRIMQSAVASLEANFLRKFLEMQKELS